MISVRQMFSLSANDIPFISADLPSLNDQICLSQSCNELHLSGSSRCNSSASSDAEHGSAETTGTELPPPHRFIRNSEQRSKFGFGSLQSATPMRDSAKLSYLSTYRKVQGQLREDVSQETRKRACNQDELYLLASEVASLFTT